MVPPVTDAFHLSMTIAGERVPGSAHFDVTNPATEEPCGTAPSCSREELERAMDAASQAYRAWRRDISLRRELMLRAAKAIGDDETALSRTLTLEQGKPLSEALDEVRGAAYWLKTTAKLDLPIELIDDDDDKRVEVRRRPLGVVGAITPWNYPVLLALWKLAPALLAGNTVVLKPSPYTPLSTLALGETLNRVLPPGVLNVVSGDDELGAWITAHPAVRKVTFTGSVRTGKRVMAAAAEDLKRVTLELGGNDAAIVLDDVDPAQIAERLFWGAFENSGQVCSAIKRLYVHESVIEPLARAIAQLAKDTKMGHGLDPEVELGPVNNRAQLEHVTGLIERARRDGASVLAGGDRRAGPGYFMPATVLLGLDDDAAVVSEEQFGPVLPILSFRDADEVIERANATPFGLSGSVWSASVERALDVGGALECGTVWINQHLAIPANAPFGGFKHSGIGREHGRWGLEAFTEPQTVNIAKR